jgi:hypothetical protein
VEQHQRQHDERDFGRVGKLPRAHSWMSRPAPKVVITRSRTSAGMPCAGSLYRGHADECSISRSPQVATSGV